MADTPRTRAELLAIYADNVTGAISAQDGRDYVVTIMNAEFAYVGDFWAQPDKANLTAEGVRGWMIYSQVMDSVMTYGIVVYMTPSGTWKQAMASDSAMNALLAMTVSAIASGDSGILLRKGLIFKSVYSGIFSGYIGRPLWLESDVIGSIAGPNSEPTNSVKIIGIVEDDTNGLFRFDPDWSIVGS